MRKLLLLLIVLALLGASATVLVPRAEHALALRLAVEDPERLTDLRLGMTFDRAVAAREIEEALGVGDIELAESFLALADARGITLDAELRDRVAAERSGSAQIRRVATRFGKGFVTGEPDGIEGLAGAATGDLLVYGDIRDLVRQGSRWVRGASVDPWMAGLATAGLAATAGTYFAGGAAAPARAGMSLFKAARRTGKMSVSLAADVGRLARSGRGARAFSALADLGRIEGKAGARAALEGMRHADDVGDLARVSRVAEKKGRSTLAILKTLGRGAIVLGAGAITGALWVLGATANIFLLVITICTIFAWLMRALWRSGRVAWRGGRYVVVKLSAAT